MVTSFCGSTTTTACALVELYSCGPSFRVRCLAGDDHLVVEPAELELVPGAEVARPRSPMPCVVLGAEPALRHQGPVLVVVVAAAGGVVVVRQAEVVAVLVVEDAPAAVLRLDRVVADPDAGVADLGAADRVVRPGRSGRGRCEGVPAVAPDGVLTLDRVTVGLVAAGVDDLEVVDVAVRTR